MRDLIQLLEDGHPSKTSGSRVPNAAPVSWQCLDMANELYGFGFGRENCHELSNKYPQTMVLEP